MLHEAKVFSYYWLSTYTTDFYIQQIIISFVTIWTIGDTKNAPSSKIHKCL